MNPILSRPSEKEHRQDVAKLFQQNQKSKLTSYHMDQYLNKSHSISDQSPEINRLRQVSQTVTDIHELRKLTVSDSKIVGRIGSDPIGRNEDDDEAGTETLVEVDWRQGRAEQQRRQSNACL